MQVYFLFTLFLTIVAKGGCFLVPFRWVRTKTFQSAPAPKILRADRPPSTGHSMGEKFSTRCLSSPLPVTFTVTVNPSSCEMHGQQSWKRFDDWNCDNVPALMAEINNLKEAVNRSDSALKTLQDKMYEKEKMDILAVLAHIYKERIVSYTLKYHNINDTDYGWKDLVVPDEDSLEARMLKSAKELYSNMDVGLITDIDYFTEIYPVPLTVRPVDSVYFVKAACKKARKFKFNEGDRQKELVVGR